MFVTLLSSDMFRALTCTSSGGKIVFTQHLVSSLSVNVCTVHWLRAEFCTFHFHVGISWCYLPCSACFVVPDRCVVLVQYYFCVLILVNRVCLFCIMQFDVFSTVHHSIELFHQPTLMHNFLYSLTICLLHYYLPTCFEH